MVFIEPTPYIVSLVDEVTKQAGGAVEVIFLRENATQQWNLAITGLNVRLLPSEMAKAVIELVRTIVRGNYAVIHLAGWSEKLILIALFTAWLLRIPVVIESDTQLTESVSLWKRAMKRAIYPFLFRIPGMLLPGGSRQATYFRHYGVKDERLMIARMTVDVAGIMRKCEEMGGNGRCARRRKFGFSEDDVVFVFVGRLLEWKGVENLLKSFDLFSAKHHNARLVVAGDGPMRDMLTLAVERNSAIRYLGRLDSQQVVEVLHASDVAVVPSHWEPWGLVVNEAMAAGLPVIASDSVGCVDDLVVDTMTGTVIKANDNEALAAAMIDMLQDKEKRDRMGGEALRSISGWTLEREADVIIKSWLVVALHGGGAL